MIDSLDFEEVFGAESFSNMWNIAIDESAFGQPSTAEDSSGPALISPEFSTPFWLAQPVPPVAQFDASQSYATSLPDARSTENPDDAHHLESVPPTDAIVYPFGAISPVGVNSKGQWKSITEPDAGVFLGLPLATHKTMATMNDQLPNRQPFALLHDFSMSQSTVPYTGLPWIDALTPLPVNTQWYPFPPEPQERAWLPLSESQSQNHVEFGGWNTGMFDYASAMSLYNDTPPAHGIPATSDRPRPLNPQPVTWPRMVTGLCQIVQATPKYQDLESVQVPNPDAREAPMSAPLPRTFAPPPDMVARAAQAEPVATPSLKKRGKKRVRDVEEGDGEERPKKVAKAGKGFLNSKRKAGVKVIRNSNQLLPELQGGVGAGYTHRQRAEHETNISIPPHIKLIIGASRKASTTSNETGTSGLHIPEPDWKDPRIIKFLSSSWDLESLTEELVWLIPCHWGYDGKGEPCGQVFTDKYDRASHMWEVHQKGDKTLPSAGEKATCLWPGCSWTGGADQLVKCHLDKTSHTHVLTRYLRLECKACGDQPRGTLEHWSRNGGKKDGRDPKPYDDHAGRCPRGHDGQWQVRQAS